jgi:hypothetical protein
MYFGEGLGSSSIVIFGFSMQQKQTFNKMNKPLDIKGFEVTMRLLDNIRFGASFFAMLDGYVKICNHLEIYLNIQKYPKVIY